MLFPIQLPALVQKAVTLAEEMNFPLMPEGRPPGSGAPPSACIPEVGRLLSVLAAAKPGGRIVEHGTGAGVGTAWLVSGMAADTALISVELDTRLAQAAARLFRDDARVEIHQGDWHEVLAGRAPADLLFMDATPRADLDPSNWDHITELVTVGGQFVMDDLTPVELWPPEWHGQLDLKREFAFSNPRVLATEVRTTPSTAALIITRIR